MFNKMQSNQGHLYLLSIIAVTLILTLMSTLLLMNPLIVTAQSTDYTDIPTGAWYKDYVQTLTNDERQIIQGYPDGSFHPLETLNRDQFITMIVRAAGFEPGNSKGYWAQGYIDKAMELGIIESDEYNNYTTSVTREEMSRMLIRTLDYMGQTTTVSNPTEVLQVVTDSEDFGYGFDDYIMKTYKLGIITGYTDHTFRPQGNLTRSEATAVIVRMIDENARIAFDFDALYDAIYAEDTIESHLMGGTNWVDPTTAGLEKNIEEDLAVLTSDFDYAYASPFYDTRTPITKSIDEVIGSIDYDSNGAYAGQVDDFERLLLRRMPADAIVEIMAYLENKTDRYTYLEHDQAYFYLDNDSYIVRLDDYRLVPIHGKNPAPSVAFNIWYRDANFIAEEEYYTTHPDNVSDYVVYHY